MGVELRPLFIGRWLRGLEFGVPHLDLALDSLGLELGAFFAEPQGAARSRPGLQAGLGLEVPFFPTASGPGSGPRRRALSDAALGGAVLSGPADRLLYLDHPGVARLLGGHVVDLGDRPSR